MFLAGMIIGVTLGVLLIRLHKLLNEMDAVFPVCVTICLDFLKSYFTDVLNPQCRTDRLNPKILIISVMRIFRM